MSITLEGIDITGLVIESEFLTNVTGVSQIANDGSLIVYEETVKFKELIFVGGSDWGWLDRTTMKALHALADVIGAYYELNYEGTVYNVRFMSEDSPVIFGDSLIKRSNAADTDYYNNIVLKLMQI